MELRSIGSLRVSLVGLGTNNFGRAMKEDDVAPVVDAALAAGITFFDTADSYGESEERIGQVLRGRRDQVVLATKFGSPLAGQPDTGGAAPDYVRRAVDASLKRLATDRIDLYQIHRPDPSTPIGDTLGAMAELVSAGKVREIGCSNFSAAQLREAQDAAGSVGLVSVQNHYNLLHREPEDEVLPLCRESGVAFLPYFPLASGLLSGKYHRGEAPPEGSRAVTWGSMGRTLVPLDDPTFDRVEALTAWAGAHDRSLLDLAFAWLAAKAPVASVIAGATTPDQVRANAAAAGWTLTPDEVREVDAIASTGATQT